MQRHRRQKRTILSGLPRPKIRPNWRRSQVGETQQKSPHFVGVFPIFRPFCPSKWEKSPNRSLSGGTGRARGPESTSTQSRDYNCMAVTVLSAPSWAGININPVAGLQHAGGVGGDDGDGAGININPVAGLQQVCLYHLSHW